VRVVLDKTMSESGIAYHRRGEGPVLLLIHGVGLMSQSWFQQLDALQNQFDIIAIDLPGHGESTPLVSNFEKVNLSEYVNKITAFIREVHEGPYYICGHSLGALISLEIAARDIDKVLGLAALNTIYQRSETALTAVQSRAKLLNDSETVAGVQQTLSRWFTDNPDQKNSAYADLCRTWLTTNDKDAYALAYKTFADITGPDQQSLKSITCPAVFMTGCLDENSNETMTQALSESVASGRASVVDDAAHMMPLTHPDFVCQELLLLKSLSNSEHTLQQA